MTDTSYQSYYKKAGFYLHSTSGFLRLSGASQFDFMQRQTSNDLQLLSEKRALLTVLTSPTARLLDVFYLLPESLADEPAIDIISITGNGRGMTAYLKSRIFFMDRVSVVDLSTNFIRISLGGPLAGKVLTKSGLSDLPEANQHIRGSIAGVDIRLVGQDAHIGFPYLLLVPSDGCEAVKSVLICSGATELSQDLVEILRVEAGLPAAAHELVDAYNPLELNLESAVSDTKGCFTGQEIIARQRTYDKVTRKLVGLTLTAPVSPGCDVMAEGRPAGNVTSAVFSPRLGHLALAVLRRPFNEASVRVEVKSGDQLIGGVVASLPF